MTKNDFTTEVVRAATRVMYDHPRSNDVDYDCGSFFADWHGGKHNQAGVLIAGTRYGFNGGWVVTHETNPPQWLCDLIDAMDCAMRDEAERLGTELDAD